MEYYSFEGHQTQKCGNGDYIGSSGHDEVSVVHEGGALLNLERRCGNTPLAKTHDNYRSLDDRNSAHPQVVQSEDDNPADMYVCYGI